MAKGYKATAQNLFFKQVTNDFPNWELVLADISNGSVALTKGDIMIYLIYDHDTDAYYPSKVVKHTKGDVAWDEKMLDNIADAFEKIPEPESKGGNV